MGRFYHPDSGMSDFGFTQGPDNCLINDWTEPKKGRRAVEDVVSMLKSIGSS